MTARHDGRKRADYVRDEERAWFPVLEQIGPWGLTELFVSRGFEPGVAYRIARFIAAHHDLIDDGFAQPTRARIRDRLGRFGPPSREDRLPSRIAIPGYVNSGANELVGASASRSADDELAA